MNQVDIDRSIAYVIDTIVIIIINFILGIPFGILLFIILGPLALLGSIVLNIFILVFPIIYFYILDSSGTVGHRIMKLKPTSADATTTNKLIRAVLKYPLIALVLFIIKLITDKWIHDDVTKITVKKL